MVKLVIYIHINSIYAWVSLIKSNIVGNIMAMSQIHMNLQNNESILGKEDSSYPAYMLIQEKKRHGCLHTIKGSYSLLPGNGELRLSPRINKSVVK